MRGLTGRSCWNSNSTTISWHELDARLWTQLFHTLCHLILTALVPLYEIGTVITHIFQTRNWGADPWKPKVTQLVSGGIEIWILSVLCQGFCLNEWISGWWGSGSWRESSIFRTSPVCPGFSLPSVCNAWKQHIGGTQSRPILCRQQSRGCAFLSWEVAFLNLLF